MNFFFIGTKASFVLFKLKGIVVLARKGGMDVKMMTIKILKRGKKTEKLLTKKEKVGQKDNGSHHCERLKEWEDNLNLLKTIKFYEIER